MPQNDSLTDSYSPDSHLEVCNPNLSPHCNPPLCDVCRRPYKVSADFGYGADGMGEGSVVAIVALVRL